ncbi:MAG TPA: Smr/MutS family protein [Saprospiraceae bacterium]|nr:Smr/MutS family protein [Saprospiraceae bacterium]
MLYAIGTKVRLRFTGERGTITGILDEGMLMVRLESDPDFEIPTFEEDLQRDEANEPVSAGAKFIMGKSAPKPEAPPARRIQSQYKILKPKGIQLAFEPMPARDGTVSRYKVWMLNDTQEEFLMEFDLFTHSRDILVVDDKLAANTALELGDFLSDDLNDGPEAFLRVRRITTAGPDDPLEHTLKIKPKQFFNSLLTAPILNVLAYQYVMLDSFEPKSRQEEQDLRDYAKQQPRKRPAQTANSRPYKAFDPEGLASFEPEIDLHIENLINGFARLDKGEILRIQLQHAQRFLDKAIRLGAPRVFLIHGVGEGKLKDSIAAMLKDNPSVVKFKNEYHHKFGYGATEVWL